MAKIIKVRCTGREQHVNEIELENLLGPNVVIHGTPIDTGRPIPERIVRKCEECSEGRVILTREMIEENL